MALPTQAEEFAKLLEYLRKAQESAAMMAHLVNASGSGSNDAQIAKGWLAISEMFKLTQHNITKLAQGKLN